MSNFGPIRSTSLGTEARSFWELNPIQNWLERLHLPESHHHQPERAETTQGHELREKNAQLTAQEEKVGLLDDPTPIRIREGWATACIPRDSRSLAIDL
jgi:hypothetical protein